MNAVTNIDSENKLPGLKMDFGGGMLHCMKYEVFRRWFELRFNYRRRSLLQVFKRDGLPVNLFTAHNVITERDFTRNLQCYLRLLNIRFPLSLDKALGFDKHSQTITDALLPRLMNLAKKLEIDITTEMEAFIRHFTREHLNGCACLLDAMNKHFLDKRPVHLLAPPGGSQLVRSVSLAVRNSGGKVTGFNHGNTPLPDCRQLWSLFDLSTVDEYIVYTEKAAKHMKKIKERYPPVKNDGVEIISEKTDLFLNLWNENRKVAPTGKIKSLMIVDHTINPDKACRNFMPDLIYVHLILNLIELLSKKRIHIIYKRHPEILRRAQDNFFSDFCEEIFTPFEQVMHKTDAYLFFTVKSSIFHHAVCTNKPIIYLDNGLDSLFDDSRRLLSKRCYFVDVYFNERNLPVFDEERLKEILGMTHGMPDTEYMEDHLFPH